MKKLILPVVAVTALLTAVSANATLYNITYDYTQDMAYAASRPLTTATPDPNNDVSAANGYGSIMNCAYTAGPCVASIPIVGTGTLNTDTGEIYLAPIDIEIVTTGGSIAYVNWSQTLTGSFIGSTFSMTTPATVNSGSLLCEILGSSSCNASGGPGSLPPALLPPQDVVIGPPPCPFCPPPAPTVDLIEEIAFSMLAPGGTGQYYYEANSSPDYTDFTINFTIGSEVPVPAAAWLFGSGLLGLASIGRKRRQV